MNLKYNQRIKSFKMDQTDIIRFIPPENILRFVHGRFRGEGAQEWEDVQRPQLII